MLSKTWFLRFISLYFYEDLFLTGVLEFLVNTEINLVKTIEKPETMLNVGLKIQIFDISHHLTSQILPLMISSLLLTNFEIPISMILSAVSSVLILNPTLYKE